jgi:hypothetical protein
MSAHDEAVEAMAIRLWCATHTKRVIDWAQTPDAQKKISRALARNLINHYLVTLAALEARG